MKLKVVLENLKKELVIRNYSKNTIKNYLSVIRGFSKYVQEQKPDNVDGKFLQEYVYYLKVEKTTPILQ
ncbi:MAG: phage integrase N-terminal SAM-like domain-containing protein [Candidatus Marinimicrobia bacterium]|nr:phage integrase N-terminal SAM-like domain-containing protein [Candidatus Neomarinimicrobiota bacterium]